MLLFVTVSVWLCRSIHDVPVFIFVSTLADIIGLLDFENNGCNWMIWSRPEWRVLFVCTANICRSPLAEGLLRQRLRAQNLAGRVQVHSAGTQAIQRGCRPDPRIEGLAAEMGVSLAGIRARMITSKMIQSSDYVLVMERRHLEHVTRLSLDSDDGGSFFARQRPIEKKTSEKIQLLGSFLPTTNGSVNDIPDPYFGDLQGFYNVYQMIDLALTGFLQHTGTHFEETGR